MDRSEITNYAIPQVHSAKVLLEGPFEESLWQHHIQCNEKAANEASDQIAATQILIGDIFEGRETQLSRAERIWL